MSESPESPQSPDSGSENRTATIKIAAADQSQRGSAGADPGPGDPNAAPSVAPQLIDIPPPPTDSQLVVKSASQPPTDKKKKVTKFRYHKRITVRTKGNQNPTAIMEKVNMKDHNQPLTPSTIGEIDPQELMRRAGIKGTNKTHWRVRLRQTKRLTKNGKTVVQTKVAYRDSEGNKQVESVSGPVCKRCEKKTEECICEPTTDGGAGGKQ